MPELLPGFGGLIGGSPDDAPVFVRAPRPIIKVLAEQAEFPELVGDVLAGVDDGAVGPNDHLSVLGQAGHDPAALQLAFGFVVDRVALLEEFESSSPEL